MILSDLEKQKYHHRYSNALVIRHNTTAESWGGKRHAFQVKAYLCHYNLSL